MSRKNDKRQEVLQFITDFLDENGYAPSVREICKGVNLQSTASVYYHLKELSKTGEIALPSMKKRAISLPASRTRGKIPIVGVVTAGMPILAVENVEGYLPWEDDPECFALRIRGDSMIGAGILDGDLVVVREQQTADHGQIVIAMIGDEATCKRLSLSSGEHVWLMPENPAYPPIDGDDASIIGIVKGVIRKY